MISKNSVNFWEQHAAAASAETKSPSLLMLLLLGCCCAPCIITSLKKCCSGFTGEGKVTGLEPQAVNTSVPSGITSVCYYWHIVIRQQRQSFKDTSFYFQLYHIYFYLNLKTTLPTQKQKAGRRWKSTMLETLDNDRKQPVF